MSRKSKGRKGIKRNLIVCGSEKTEKLYFKSLKNHLRNQGVHVESINIENTKTKNQAPDKLLNEAKKLVEKYDLDFKNGDKIWCVFDYDDFDINIKESINLKKFSKIEKIISTRCFEVWYLLHFKYTTKYFNKTSEIEKMIGKYLSDSKYKKNVSYFKEILSKQETAINNAKKLKKHHEDQGIGVNTKKANPQTEVYRLVEYLNNLTK